MPGGGLTGPCVPVGYGLLRGNSGISSIVTHDTTVANYASGTPATVQAGDYQIVVVADDADVSSPALALSTENGTWNSYLNNPGIDGTTSYAGVFWRQLTGSNMGFTVNNKSVSTTAVTFVSRGADLTSPPAYSPTGLNNDTAPAVGGYTSDMMSVIGFCIQDEGGDPGEVTGGLWGETKWDAYSGDQDSICGIAWRTGITGTATPGDWVDPSSGNFMVSWHVQLLSL